MAMTELARRGFLGGALAAVLSLAAGPDGATQAQTAQPIKVVVTVAMIGDAVKAVGGERVKVETLLGEGVDPHLYKPTRADIAKMNAADVIVANGLHLEAQFDDTFRQLMRTKTVVLAADSLPKDRLLADKEYNDRSDPHVWMDAELWTGVVAAIRDAMTKRDPAGRETYAKGHDGYVAELKRLDAYAKRSLGSIPKERRVLLTAHDAFNYFGRAYDVEVIGVQGVSTESEAGLKKIEEIVDLVVTRKLPAIFVESSVSDRNIKAVVEGAAKRGHTLVIGAELFSDAMGRPGTYEGTFIGMLDHNVTNVTRALGGDAPQRGLNGMLEAGT
jgi:manganese/zinc/iron transport system substrate-binding protein